MKSNRDRAPWFDRVLVSLALGCGVVYVGLMIATIVDVVVRELGGHSIAGLYEFTAVVLAGCVFLGLPYTTSERMHVRTRLLTSRLRGGTARAVRIVSRVATVAIVAWMTWATGEIAWRSVLIQEFDFGIIRVPVWPGKVAVAIGCLLMLIVVIRQLLTARSEHEEAHDLGPTVL